MKVQRPDENNAEANIVFVANNRVKPNDTMVDSG